MVIDNVADDTGIGALRDFSVGCCRAAIGMRSEDTAAAGSDAS
jgi:hypothetical protein